MSDDDLPKLIATIDRAVEVLLLFTRADGPDLGVTEIAAHLGLSKAVVHRILQTLLAKGLLAVNGDSRRYQLGPLVLSFSEAYVRQSDTLGLIMRHLRDLSRRTDETATVSYRNGWERVYVGQVTPDREVKMTVPIGKAFPLHAGAISKSFLAFLPEEEQARYLRQSELLALTDQTITDRDALRDVLGRVRRDGYSTSFGERTAGSGSVAAPLLDRRGLPVAVISVCGPVERFRGEVDHVIEHVLSVQADLSRILGERASETRATP